MSEKERICSWLPTINQKKSPEVNPPPNDIRKEQKKKMIDEGPEYTK